MKARAAMMHWSAALLLLALGCHPRGSVTAEMPGQGVALQIVWAGEYGRRDAPPELRYVLEPNLPCLDPNSGRPGWKTLVGCREGYTPDAWHVSIAWHRGDRFSTTTFAHELLHAALAREGIVDPFHKSGVWGMVDTANLKLEAAGL